MVYKVNLVITQNGYALLAGILDVCRWSSAAMSLDHSKDQFHFLAHGLPGHILIDLVTETKLWS